MNKRTLSASSLIDAFRAFIRVTPGTREDSADSPADVFSNAQARSYVEQVNRRLLKGIGVISESPDELRLVWLPPGKRSSQRRISIRILDSQTLTINGQEFPATPDGVKQGLINSLKEGEKQNQS